MEGNYLVGEMSCRDFLPCFTHPFGCHPKITHNTGSFTSACFHQKLKALKKKKLKHTCEFFLLKKSSHQKQFLIRNASEKLYKLIN
jgi:hypothetical protein